MAQNDYNILIERAEKAAHLMKILAHPIRLLVLCYLGNEEKTVNELEKLLNTSQSNLSQHLAKLRDNGILTARKEANMVFYSIKDLDSVNLIDALQGCSFCEK